MNHSNFQVGQKCQFSKAVSDADVRAFAEVTGDNNPLHLDDAFAQTTMFGKRIAHGMIGAGLISAAIGMHLPGIGTTYLGQTLNFKAPVFIGETLTVTIEITAIEPKKRFDIATLRTLVTNEEGVVVIEGEAKVIPPSGDEAAVEG